MRLYFKNRRSPKAYKVIISSQENSHISFIGAVTNPTMKIGNGVVQFYLAPIASKGTWTINEDYHFKDGNLTLMAYKNLNYTSYNSHATYSDFTPNIQKALSYLEFHNFETISDSVKIITGLSDATWMYDQENNKFLFFTEFESGSLTPLRLASQINLLLNSDDSVLKYNAELFIRELISDLFKPSPKGILSDPLFSTSFRNNAVITVLGEDEYKDTYLDSNTTSSINFSQGFADRIPSTNWYAEGNGQLVEGGEAFSHTVFKTGKDVTDSLQTPSKLLTGGSTPFTLSFDLMIKEDQVFGDFIPLLSKNKNTVGGDQCLYISTDGRLVFERKINVGGNHILPVTGLRRIEYNTKFTIKIVYDGNMFKVFVNDVLDLQFGSIVGIHTDTDQPYRFLNNLVPSYVDYRAVTNGFIDNIQVQDGVALDPTEEYNAYQENLVSQLRFQGQVGKTSFVDEANRQINWTGYGDAKLVQGTELGLYSYLSLDGMGSYIKTLDSEPFKFNNKFTIHIKFKTSTTSKRQILLDRYEGLNGSNTLGAYQVSINTDGKLYFTMVKSSDWRFVESVSSNLNNGQINTIDIVKDGDSLSMYMNGLLDSMHDVTGEVFNGTVVNTTIGAQINNRNEAYDFKGNIYEFEVYKGVAVYPEIKAKELDKVELNFDTGSPIDIYGNSTWTNNGVTFDQVNSVKGYSAYFGPNSQKLYCGQNNNLNFENKNFHISMDIKPTENRDYSVIIGSTTTAFNSNQASHISYYGSSANNYSIAIGSNNSFDINGGNLYLNNYYKTDFIRCNNNILIKINDVISCSSAVSDTNVFNLNDSNGTQIGHGWSNSYSNNKYVGYIDNFKAIKNYQEETIIDRPAVHLPLETNAINTGFIPLTINNVGNPTYTTVDGKKCIKFESGKYLTINSNNIFNLGTNSDFYIEFDFMLDGTSTTDRYLLSPVAMWSSSKRITYLFVRNSTNKLVFQTGNNATTEVSVTSNNSLSNNTFYNCKLTRFGNVFKILIDNEVWITADNVNLDISQEGTYIGYTPNDGYLKGYMSDFKMFVGTSEPVESYDHRKVLNLDFKPTYKSYLFKDNNNKLVIHPVGISYRGYENGRYCLNLNGTNQYLSLGKSNLLNLGLDDFIISFEFKLNKYSTLTSTFLLHDGNEVNSQNGRFLIGIANETSNSESKKLHVMTTYNSVNQSLFTDEEIELDKLYKVIVYRFNGILHIQLNDNLYTKEFNFPLNANLNDNTYIGYRNVTNSKTYLNGTIYSVKILRDTADLSLLDKEILVPEDPGDGIIIDGPPPLEKGILRFWEERKEIDPHNVVLEFKQLRLSD